MTRKASSPWLGGRPPHLPCRLGELPAAVLFPGDPARVDRLASVLDGFRILGQNREFRIGAGTYRGVPIGVCSTGIGGPSTEIAMVEAAELGCRYALRIGGTGALKPEIPLGALLIVEEAVRGGGAAALYADSSQRALIHPDMLRALESSVQRTEHEIRKARVCSVDGYYAGQGRPYPGSGEQQSDILSSYALRDIDCLDMESETVLVLGEKLGLVAGVILAVHANRYSDTWLEDFEGAQDSMIQVACEALSSLCRESPQATACRTLFKFSIKKSPKP